MVKVGGSSEILASFIDFFETSFRQSVKILEGVFLWLAWPTHVSSLPWTSSKNLSLSCRSLIPVDIKMIAVI